MPSVIYNDDSGEGTVLLRECSTVAAADAEADRLNGLLEKVLRVGQHFVYDPAEDGPDRIAAKCAAYEATPEWKQLHTEFPDFFTSADAVGLYAYWPTIDSED